MFQELISARNSELLVASHVIEQRMAWAELSKLDRLERALKTVKGRLQMLPYMRPEAN